MSGIIPADFTLLTNQKDRLAPDKLRVFIDALLDDNHKMKFYIRFRSGPTGSYRKWVEIRGTNIKGSYTLVFGLSEDLIVQQLWVVLTPSGACYSIDKDGGNPFTDHKVTWAEQERLTQLLVVPTFERKVVVVPYWKVEITTMDGGTSAVGAMYDHGSGGPKGVTFPRSLTEHPALFREEAVAKKAAEDLEKYFEDQSNKLQKAKNAERKKEK